MQRTFCCLAGLVTCIVAGFAAEDLKVQPPVYEQPAENAFNHYLRAAELLPADRQWDEFVGALDAADPADIESTVLRAQEALDELRRGIGKPCVMPGELDFSSLLPYLAQFRSMTRLLAVEGWMYVQLDEFGAAFTAYRDAMTLGQDGARNGTLIHKLVSIACETIACSHIRKAAGLGGAEEEELADMVQYLAAFEATEVPLSETLAVEYGGARRSLEKAKTDKDVRALLADDSKVLVTGPLIDDALAGLASYYAQMIAVAKTDHWRWTGELPQPPKGNRLLQVIVPALQGMRSRITRHQANLRGTMLVVALELYFAHNGAYPQELTELVPDVIDATPIDPFCGEPFRYNLVDALDYQLYSVGENLTDDGGLEESQAGPGEGDIPFSTVK
jgi:hypothetical protein